MNLLAVLESYAPNIGGVERLFAALCEGFAARGHAVTVVTTRCPGAPARERVHGVNVVRLPVANRYLFSFVSIPVLLRRASRHDLVLTTSYNAALPAWIAARCRRKKIIVTFHEVWGALWFKLPFLNRIQQTGYFAFERLLLRLPFDRFVAVSHATAERLRRHGVPPARITVIYNGVDYGVFDGYRHAPRGPFTCCYFGRPGVSKGLDVLLDAAARFSRQHPETRFKLVMSASPKSLYKKITRRIARHRLAPHIILRHSLPQDELFRELAASHCVVIPSYSEGFCFAAVEAAALDVPVVSSGRGALPEVVSGRHLTLDALTPDALCAALEKAMAGQWTSTPVKRFDIKDTVQAYLILMDEVDEV